MMARFKAGLLSLRDLFATAWWIFLIVGIGFYVAYQFVEPAPPNRIVITTGSDSGAYYQFAQRYAAILARNGITLEVKTSAGSLQNIERLKNDEAQVGFVQGGVVELPEDPDAADDSGLLSLGSVFYEPVWVFYRGEKRLDRLTELRGKRIAIGQEGSGVRQLAQQLLAANEIKPGDHLLPLSGLKAAEELQQGRIDAAFVIAAENAPVVQVLRRSPGVKVMSFAQADAYHRRFPFLSKLTLPRMPFLEMAKAAGAKFTFGSNGRFPEMGKIEFCIATAKQLGLGAADMFRPVSGETVADSISVSLPRDGEAAVQAIRESGGFGVTVPDAAILAAIGELARGAGVFAERAAAATWAGLKQAARRGLLDPAWRVVALVTGNGLKDVAAAMKAAGEPRVIPPDPSVLDTLFPDG